MGGMCGVFSRWLALYLFMKFVYHIGHGWDFSLVGSDHGQQFGTHSYTMNKNAKIIVEGEV
jgi:hypothetical protein